MIKTPLIYLRLAEFFARLYHMYILILLILHLQGEQSVPKPTHLLAV